MTVDRLLTTVPSSELTEWMAFYGLEPFGSAIEDYRAGIGATVTHNAHRGKDTKPMLPHEFFPWSPERKPDDGKILVGKTPEEISAHIKALLGRVD